MQLCPFLFFRMLILLVGRVAECYWCTLYLGVNIPWYDTVAHTQHNSTLTWFVSGSRSGKCQKQWTAPWVTCINHDRIIWYVVKSLKGKSDLWQCMCDEQYIFVVCVCTDGAALIPWLVCILPEKKCLCSWSCMIFAVSPDEERELTKTLRSTGRPYPKGHQRHGRGRGRRHRPQYRDSDTYNPNSQIFKPWKSLLNASVSFCHENVT